MLCMPLSDACAPASVSCRTMRLTARPFRQRSGFVSEAAKKEEVTAKECQAVGWRRSCPATAALPSQNSWATCGKCCHSYHAQLHQCPRCVAVDREAAKKNQAMAKEAQAVVWRRLSPLPFKEPVCWENALEMKWCHGGSGGVFVVKFAAGAICVRGSNWNPGELFAQRLSTLLGVRTALDRVVHPKDSESKAIRCAVQSAKPDTEDSRLKLNLIFKAESLTVLQYVDGIVMMGVPAHEHLKQLSARSPLWYQIGRLAAFDMLINNFDRFPLVWSNCGNLGNVMINSSLGAVTGIDQCVQEITHPTGFTNYLSRVRQAVAEARGAPGKAFEAIKTAVYNNTAIELSASEMGEVRTGVLDFIAEVVSLMESGEFEEILRSVSEDVADVFARAPVALGESGFKQDPTLRFCDFVRHVAVAAKEALQSTVDHPAALQQMHEWLQA